MLGFGPVGSAPLGAIPVYNAIAPSIDSADWTGLEVRLNSDPAAVEQIKQNIVALEAALSQAGLTNSETAQAKALTGAILTLVEAPEPEWKVIARLLVTLLDSKPVNAAINSAAICGLIGAALKGIGVW
jgi:hypothetical protein